MITRKAGPALAAGCTVGAKPASQTPFSALALAELARARRRARRACSTSSPARPREIGGELTSNPIVRKLSFTGSTEVGKLLMAQCAGTVKKLSLELGGNAPFIVFDDADLDAAVEGAIASKYRNTGQTCVCANRLLVQAAVYDAFAAQLATRRRQAEGRRRPRGGRAPRVRSSTTTAVEKVESHIARRRVEGRDASSTGGHRHAPAAGSSSRPS